MKWQGWVFMMVSWAALIGLLLYCLIRTLQGRREGPE